MSRSVPTCWVMNDTSRSRRIGINGFWTAPILARATRSTTASIVVGNCHETTLSRCDPSSRERSGCGLRFVSELGSCQRPAVVVGYHKGIRIVPWPLDR